MFPTLRNAGATERNSTATARPPITAPTAGIPRKVAEVDLVLTRSSPGVADAVVICGSPCSLGREGRDGCHVRGVDEGRAGCDVLAAADGVAVVLVRPQGVDREVALQVRLLVDRPGHLAVLDGCDELLTRVESADLGRAAGVRDCLDCVEGELGPESDDEVDRLVGRQGGLDVGGDRRVIATVDIDPLDLGTGGPLGDTVTAVLELLLALLLDHAQDVLGSV